MTTTTNTQKQFRVRDTKGNNWFLRVGDTVTHEGEKFTVTAFDTFRADSNKLADLYVHLRPTTGLYRYVEYVAATERFNLVHRATVAKPVAKPAPAVVVKSPTPETKYIPALAKGGGSMWLSVGGKYRVFLRNKHTKARFGTQEIDEAKLTSIEPKDGYHMLHFRSGNKKHTVPTISAPSITKTVGGWERYFEKAQ